MKAAKKTVLFKKPISLVVVLVPLFLFNSVVSKQCKCHKQGKIVINKPVKAPVAISFIDANRLLSIQILNARVTLIDEGKQVVTPNNLSFSSLEVRGGVMCVALKDSARFSRDNPYRFAIKVESPGYSANYRSILITEDTAQYIPVFMTKIEDPPDGMAGFTGNFPITNSTINSNIILTPKKTNNQKRKISVSFADSTVLISYGKRLPRNATSVIYNFSYASPRSLAALRTFPGGPLVTDAVDSIGKVIATPKQPFLFTSAGWMNLEMNSNDQVITEFSKPVELRLPIENSLLNPTTLAPYKIGDKIDIWSLNDLSIWKKEDIAVVTASDDGLIATMRIRHLTPWNLDFKTDVCTSLTEIPFSNSTGAMVRAYCEIVGTQTGGTPLGFYGSKILDYAAGTGTQEVINGQNDVDAAFLVYDNMTGPGPIRASSTFTFCPVPPTTPGTLNITSATINSLDLDFDVVDPSTTPATLIPLCHNAVFFLPGTTCVVPSTTFQYGGNLTGDGRTTLFQSSTFNQTNIRIVDGDLVGGSTVLTTFDFVINLADRSGNPTTTPLMTNCSSTGKLVTYRWDTDHFYIEIPGGSGGIEIITSCP